MQYNTLKFSLKGTLVRMSKLKLLGKSLLYRNSFSDEDLMKTISLTEFSKLWAFDNSIVKYP